MNIGDLLVAVAAVLLVLDIPVAVILVRAAWQKPRIWLLTLMALVSVGIAVVVGVSILAVANIAAGYPVPPDVTRLGFRAALLVLAAFPPIFLWVYRTGRFRDEETP